MRRIDRGRKKTRRTLNPAPSQSDRAAAAAGALAGASSRVEKPLARNPLAHVFTPRTPTRAEKRREKKTRGQIKELARAVDRPDVPREIKQYGPGGAFQLDMFRRKVKTAERGARRDQLAMMGAPASTSEAKANHIIKLVDDSIYSRRPVEDVSREIQALSYEEKRWAEKLSKVRGNAAIKEREERDFADFAQTLSAPVRGLQKVEHAVGAGLEAAGIKQGLMPAFMSQTVRDVLEMTVGAPGGIIMGVASPGRAAKAVKEDFSHRYGPLFRGDFGGFYQANKEHPVFFALDLAGGAQMLAKGAQIAGVMREASAVRKLKLGDESRGEVQLFRSPAASTSHMQDLLDRLSERHPEMPVAGAQSRVAKALERASENDLAELKTLAVSHMRSARKLSKPEKIAYDVIRRYGSDAPQFVRLEINKRARFAKSTLGTRKERILQARQVEQLQRSLSHVDQPSERLIAALAQGKALSTLTEEMKFALGTLNPDTAAERLNLSARIFGDVEPVEQVASRMKFAELAAEHLPPEQAAAVVAMTDWMAQAYAAHTGGTPGEFYEMAFSSEKARLDGPQVLDQVGDADRQMYDAATVDFAFNPTQGIEAVAQKYGLDPKTLGEYAQANGERITGRILSNEEVWGQGHADYDADRPLYQLRNLAGSDIGAQETRFPTEPFRKPAIEAVEKLPEKVSREELFGRLKKAGIKDEEIKWSGLERFAEGKKSLSRDEILAWLDDQYLHLEENIRYPEGAADTRADDVTKFESYTLDLGENYRELTIRMPESEYGEQFRYSAHFDEPNVLVHMRFKERRVGGERTLFIEEIQSDWHQQAQQRGYRKPIHEHEDYERRVRELDEANAEREKWENVLVARYGNAPTTTRAVATMEDKLRDLRDHLDATYSVRPAVAPVRASQDNWEIVRTYPDGSSGIYGLYSDQHAAETALGDLHKSVQTVRDANDWDARLEELSKYKFALRMHQEKFSLMQALSRDVMRGVPDAPFKKTWHELAMKRMLAWAVENGFTRLSWTTGRQQAARYNLGNFLDLISIEQFYDKKLVSFANKYLKKLKVEVRLDEITPDVAPRKGKIITHDIDHPTPYVLDVGDGPDNPQFATYIEAANEMSFRYDETPLFLAADADDLTVIGSMMTSGYTAEQIDYWRGQGAIFLKVAGRDEVMERYAPSRPVWGPFVDAQEANNYVRDMLAAKESAKTFKPIGESVHTIDLTEGVRDFIQEGQALWQRSGPDLKGAVEFSRGPGAIHAEPGKADVTTFVHEPAHILRRFMPEEQLARVEEALGIPDGIWTRKQEEDFARLVEAYFWRGKEPAPQTRRIFNTLSRGMREVHRASPAPRRLRAGEREHVYETLDELFDPSLALQAGDGAFFAPDVVSWRGSGGMGRKRSMRYTPERQHRARGILYEQGRVLRGPDVVTREFFKTARQYHHKVAVDALDDFSIPRDPDAFPETGGVPPGYVLFNPRGHEIPRIYKETPTEDDVMALFPMEAARKSQQQYDELIDAYFPDRLEGVPDELHEDMRAIPKKIADQFENRGVMFKASQIPAMQRILQFIDTTNSITKAAVVFGKFSYVPVNLAGNAIFLTIRSGPWAAPALVRASKVLGGLDPEVLSKIDFWTGEGSLESLATERGPGRVQTSVRTLAHYQSAIADRLPRRAAWIYAAAKNGFIKEGDLVKLLDGSGDVWRNGHTYKEMRNQVSMDARNAMVDFGGMGEFQKQVLSRVIFIYGWMRGATKYAGRLALDYPVRTDLIAHLGQDEYDRVEKRLGKVVSYLEGLHPVGEATEMLGIDTEPVRNLRAINPVSTGGEVLMALANLATGDTGGGFQAIDFMAPALKIPVEFLTGYNTFFGEKYDNRWEAVYGQVPRWPLIKIPMDLISPKVTDPSAADRPANRQPNFIRPNDRAARVEDIEEIFLGSVRKRNLNPKAAQARAREESGERMGLRDHVIALEKLGRDAKVGKPTPVVMRELGVRTAINESIDEDMTAVERAIVVARAYAKRTSNFFPLRHLEKGGVPEDVADKLSRKMRKALYPHLLAYERRADNIIDHRVAP